MVRQRLGRAASGAIPAISLAGLLCLSGAATLSSGHPARAEDDGQMLGALDAAAGTARPETVAPRVGPARLDRGPVTSLPLPRFVSIRADTANARRGPGLDYRVDWAFVRRSLPVEVTAEYGNWRRVRDAEGYGGWVHHTLLSGVRTGIVQGAGNVALRANPDDAALVMAYAEPGVIVRIEACRGGWCRIAAGRTEGWTHRAALWGVSAEETIE